MAYGICLVEAIGKVTRLPSEYLPHDAFRYITAELSNVSSTALIQQCENETKLRTEVALVSKRVVPVNENL